MKFYTCSKHNYTSLNSPCPDCEALSDHALLGEVIAEIKKESSAGNEDFIKMKVKTLKKILGKYLA